MGENPKETATEHANEHAHRWERLACRLLESPLIWPTLQDGNFKQKKNRPFAQKKAQFCICNRLEKRVVIVKVRLIIEVEVVYTTATTTTTLAYIYCNYTKHTTTRHTNTTTATTTKHTTTSDTTP